MSIVKRLWQRIMKPSYFVGKDLEGNKYFEHQNVDNGRSKRTVKYRRNEDMWAYIASGKRLPVQWSSWLTHTRPDPPTIEELRADLIRQQKVRMNAVLLEAKEQQERVQRTRLPAPDYHSKIEAKSPFVSQNVPMNQKMEHAEPLTRDPWAEALKGSDEPQPWTPVARRK